MYNQNNADDRLVICELVNYAATFYGNFMESLFDLENKLKKRNVNNKMINTFYKSARNCEWVKGMMQNDKEIHFLSNSRIKGFIELSNIIKNNNINILHLHFDIPIIICFLLKLYYSNVRIIAHFHNTLTGIGGGEVKRKIKVTLYNKIIDLFCGCSEAVYADLVNCGINKFKCCYIDNGIVFSRLDINVENGKELYNLKDKKILMIYGTHFYRKGVDIAINAIETIEKKYNIILMVVCQNEDFVLAQIKKIFGFIPEWIMVVPSQENVACYYKMSDIYLIPSREEGFAYALLESIYCGTLTIRSDLPAMDRKIPNELIVPLNDIYALRETIESILSSTDNRRQIILATQKEYIIQRWNIDIWSNKIISMYLNVTHIK